MRKTKELYFLCLCTIVLTGCWDVVNIEDRGFIVGTAIDLEDEQANKTQFSVTNQMALPEALGASTQNGSKQQEAFLNFTSVNQSIYKIDEEIASRSSKRPFYEHLVVLVVSEEVAKQEKTLVHLLDMYIRDVDFRRSVKVVVSKGSAKEVLSFTSLEDKLPAIHIDKVLDHGSKQVGSITPKTTGDLEEYHLTGNSYVLPYLEITDIVEQKQGAVIHGRQEKMVGIFNEEEMSGLEMIFGNHPVKIIDFTFDEEVFALKVVRFKSNMKVDPSNLEEIKVSIEIELEGTIKESFAESDLTETSVLEDIQDAIAEEFEQLVRQALTKGQEEFGADVFNVWKEMKKTDYDTWVELKDDWEEGEYYFKNVTFDIEVKPQVYSIGTTNKTY